MRYFVLSTVLVALMLCSCRNGKTDMTQASTITAQMAYEGVNNYCHSQYDWSVAKENPSMMSVTMGEETEAKYQVIFRSYTGALVYFYVDKSSGTTRIVETVPSIQVETQAGTISLLDYLDRDREETEQQ